MYQQETMQVPHFNAPRNARMMEQTASPVKEGDVRSAVTELKATTDELNATVYGLLGRLAPVTCDHPRTVDGQKEVPPTPGNCALSRELYGVIEHLRGMASTVREQLGNLEV